MRHTANKGQLKITMSIICIAAVTDKQNNISHMNKNACFRICNVIMSSLKPITRHLQDRAIYKLKLTLTNRPVTRLCLRGLCIHFSLHSAHAILLHNQCNVELITYPGVVAVHSPVAYKIQLHHQPKQYIYS